MQDTKTKPVVAKSPVVTKAPVKAKAETSSEESDSSDDEPKKPAVKVTQSPKPAAPVNGKANGVAAKVPVKKQESSSEESSSEEEEVANKVNGKSPAPAKPAVVAAKVSCTLFS